MKTDTVNVQLVTDSLDKGWLSNQAKSRAYKNIVKDMEKAGIPFKLIRSRLIQAAKENGQYAITWHADGEKWKSYKDCLKERHLWASKINLFERWLKRTYASYGRLKADVPKTDNKLKNDEFKKVLSSVSTILRYSEGKLSLSELETLKVLLDKVKAPKTTTVIRG